MLLDITWSLFPWREDCYLLTLIWSVLQTQNPGVSVHPNLSLLQGHYSNWIRAYLSGLIWIHLFKDLTSKYNLILKYRGLWLQYINLEGKGHNLDHTNGHAITFIVSPKTRPSLKIQFCAHYASCSVIKLSQGQGLKPFLLTKYFRLGKATFSYYFAGMVTCWSLGSV